MKTYNLSDNNYLMIDHLHRFINLLCKVRCKIHPMAVALDLNSMLISNVDVKIHDNPTDEILIRRYKNKLQKMLAKQTIQSYCIAIDILTSNDTNTEATNTIAFMIKKNLELETETIYYSYSIGKYGEFEVKSIW